MYEPDTILALKDPRTEGAPDTEDYKPFAYDRVRVVGVSPINHGAHGEAEWTGASGQGVLLEPLTDFGAILDEPFGKLQKLYTVEEVPIHEGTIEAPIRVVNSATAAAGKTPEEVFADEAPGEKSKDGKRVRTPHSPLDALLKDEDTSTSPLGSAKPDSE